MHEVVAIPQEYDIALFDGDDVQLRHDGSPLEVMRVRIGDLVQSMLEATDGGPGVVLPVDHEFVDGMYFRKMFIPKGTLVAGQIHLVDCMNIVGMGDITVLTEYGCRRLGPGYTGVSRAGIQKIGYAHEDTVFINAFRTDETDLEKIEAAIATKDIGALGLPYDPLAADRLDYASFLVEYGLTEEFVRSVVDDMRDHIELPEHFQKCVLGASPIHGDGMFAATEIQLGEGIAPARIGSMRTVVGRMTNHARHPNCMFLAAHDGGLAMVALRRIAPGEELTVDYRQAARANTASGLHPKE